MFGDANHSCCARWAYSPLAARKGIARSAAAMFFERINVFSYESKGKGTNMDLR